MKISPAVKELVQRGMRIATKPVKHCHQRGADDL